MCCKLRWKKQICASFLIPVQLIIVPIESFFVFLHCINHHHREVHVLGLCCFLQKDAYWWEETYSSLYKEAASSLLVAVQWAGAVLEAMGCSSELCQSLS